jgi:hypothetical protein
MYYRLTDSQENEFLRLPETGMGYQIIDAKKSGSYLYERYIVLNSEIAIEMNGMEEYLISMVLLQGTEACKRNLEYIQLKSIQLINNKLFRDIAKEPENKKEKGAIDNPVENASGEEIFVRLSAFDNDRRVDKENRCLRPGSFTTTEADYLECKYLNDDPVERYALPSNDEIKWAFYIQPVKTDTLQRGTVQPANGKEGGGKEAYFEKGTAKGTFFKQTEY